MLPQIVGRPVRTQVDQERRNEKERAVTDSDQTLRHPESAAKAKALGTNPGAAIQDEVVTT